MGIPILATDVKGINEIIRNDFNGLLSHGQDVNSLIDLIKIATQTDRHKRISLSNMGKKQVREQNDIEIIIKNQLNNYEKLFKLHE